MNLTILRYSLFDRIKPIYRLNKGDKFLLTAKIEKDLNAHTQSGYPSTSSIMLTPLTNPKPKQNRDQGLYFLKIVLNNKPMWRYTYNGHDLRNYGKYCEIKYETHLLNEKGFSGVIENKIFYKKMERKNLKDYLVLYE